MPVATWRRPVLAPVYALVTAFLVVVGIGMATGAPASAATLRITADPGDLTELTGSVIEIRDPAGPPVAIGELSPDGTYNLPGKALGRTLCLRLPARWHVAAPPMSGACTTNPLAEHLAADFPVTVSKDARVRVEFTGLPGDQAAAKFGQTKVSVRNGTPIESGPLDASGHYQPHTTLTGSTICVTPPRGWIVPSADRTGVEWCLTSPVTDPHKDISVTLEQGGQG